MINYNHELFCRDLKSVMTGQTFNEYRHIVGNIRFVLEGSPIASLTVPTRDSDDGIFTVTFRSQEDKNQFSDLLSDFDFNGHHTMSHTYCKTKFAQMIIGVFN